MNGFRDIPPPSIPGSKLFAIGQVLLHDEPDSMRLLSPIWNCQSAVIGETAPNVPAEYRWQYNVNIPRPDAERVREILWKAARAKATAANPGTRAGAAQVTLELAELWDGIVQEL